MGKTCIFMIFLHMWEACRNTITWLLDLWFGIELFAIQMCQARAHEIVVFTFVFGTVIVLENVSTNTYLCIVAREDAPARSTSYGVEAGAAVWRIPERELLLLRLEKLNMIDGKYVNIIYFMSFIGSAKHILQLYHKMQGSSFHTLKKSYGAIKHLWRPKLVYLHLSSAHLFKASKLRMEHCHL